MSFHFSQQASIQKAKYTLYKSIADQVALAVANILANEEILEREREKTLKLAVVNALTGSDDWESRLLQLTRSLAAQLPLDFAWFSLHHESLGDWTYRFNRVGSDEYQVLGEDGLLWVTGLKETSYASLRQALPGAQPVLFNGADFEGLGRQHPLLKALAGRLGLQAGMHQPLPLTPKGQLSIVLFTKRLNGYGEGHLLMFTGLIRSLTLTVEKILAYEEVKRLKEKLEVEKAYLREEIKATHNFDQIIGSSFFMQKVFHLVRQVAPTDTTVLVEGETGTGKELIARALHNASPRKDKVLVKVNCAALPAQLIESELFGHEKGAFTGATERRIGKFELAHGGTLFLDEIGELPLELQPKLLRVIQEKEIERIGGRAPVTCDVRIVAATNRQLEQEVAAGRFRADLYYRLSVFPIQLPPLRERRDDIPPLAEHFARKFSKKIGKPFMGIREKAMQELLAHAWPGNIRELQNIIEQAVILCENALEWSRPLAALRAVPAWVIPSSFSAGVTSPEPGRDGQTTPERNRILAVLARTGGRIRGEKGAAAMLGIKPTTLEARIKRLGIGKRHIAEP